MEDIVNFNKVVILLDLADIQVLFEHIRLFFISSCMHSTISTLKTTSWVRWFGILPISLRNKTTRLPSTTVSNYS